MQKFYEVYVAGFKYHGGALTYSSDKKLEAGQLVQVPLRQKISYGIVKKEVSKPQIEAKPLDPLALPALPEIYIKLLEWLAEYYPAPAGSIAQLFIPASISKNYIDKYEAQSSQAEAPNVSQLPKLTTEQKNTLASIKSGGTNYLHGETGSGKTRIYQELAVKTVKAGASVLILSPEIGLSSQLFHEFSKIFGNRVVVYHSHLTAKERLKAWIKILTAREPLVVIGARSALFVPVQKLGLLVVDEAHDSSYKQEQAPYYNAIRVSGKLAALHGATLMMGTATPAITDYYIAKQRNASTQRLSKLAIDSPTTFDIEVVDIKSRENFTRSSHLSNQLLQDIEKALAENEQILLFLNRRGTARAVLCQVCGWQALCSRCDTPLTYHGDIHSLVCHVCNYRSAMVSNCPVCGSVDVLFKSAGTKAIVDEVKKIFPRQTIQRFDADNLKSERFEQNYQKIKNGDVHILVGTQTLAKGLDLPKLSLVGVITADSSLFMPDYLAQERTYQLISQVMGRVGRGHRNGKVVVQTYSPDSQLLKDALAKNWQNFYDKELIERKKFLFPPFYYLLKLSCKRATAPKAQQAAKHFADQLAKDYPKIIISGPAPAYHEKQGNKFEWQLVIRSKNRKELVDIAKALPSGWTYDLDPINLL